MDAATNSPPHVDTDILVAGAGAAGLACALALADSRFSVTLVGRPEVSPAARTVALMDGSIRFLDALGVWSKIAANAAPLRVMRLVDDTRSLLPSPPVEFAASEIGIDAFGWNVENHLLVSALANAAREDARIRFVEDMVAAYEIGSSRARVVTAASGAIDARLVAAADGRRSGARRAARLPARTWDYPQVAITAAFAHTRPHNDVSTEFHTREGPCTFVPLPPAPDAPLRSSLVWLMSPQQAERRFALDDAEFCREAERASHLLLGDLSLIRQRARIPMQGLAAREMAGRRVALVGEAAHVFPPIGAQGLNLGLRDAAHLAELLCGADVGADPGAPDVLARYERLRRGDVTSRTLAVDTLNRSLLSRFAGVEIMRGAGLFALANVGPLRRFAMREGVLPGVGASRVMRRPAAMAP